MSRTPLQPMTPSSSEEKRRQKNDSCPLPENWPKSMNWKQRIKHVTWAYFTLTMATGGVANVLHTVPFRFRGLETIGVVVFLMNICFFLAICTLLSLRFYFYPYTFKASFYHPTESLFVPAAAVSFGTILINISQYGLGHTGHWLNNAVTVLFWVDAALAMIFSGGIYLTLWSTQYFSISTMTPIWIFPAYPLLIIGPHAGILSGQLRPTRGLDVIIGGFAIQGIGYMVSFMVYAAFIYRLMTQKLPRESVRPGMFVSVGPSGFTVAGTISMAANLERCLPADFMGNGAMTATILRIVANWMCLWIWGLALWFFFVSVAAHWTCVRGQMKFAMNWYSFIFPNTALTTATFGIGRAFDNHPIKVVGCVMTVALIMMWCFVFGMMVRAFFLHQIMWPQQGEDKDEGGFKVEEHRLSREYTREGHGPDAGVRGTDAV